MRETGANYISQTRCKWGGASLAGGVYGITVVDNTAARKGQCTPKQAPSLTPSRFLISLIPVGWDPMPVISQHFKQESMLVLGLDTYMTWVCTIVNKFLHSNKIPCWGFIICRSYYSRSFMVVSFIIKNRCLPCLTVLVVQQKGE